MYKSYIAIVTFLTVLSVASCTKDNSSTPVAKAVVEAYLQPGITPEIKITKEILANSNEAEVQAINNLNVVVAYNGTPYTFTNNGNGIYKNNTMPVIAGGQYNLAFAYNNQNITAITTIPNKPTNFSCNPTSITVPVFSGGGNIPTIPDPIKAAWNNNEQAYHYILIKPVDSAATEISNANQRPTFANAPDQANTKNLNFNQFKYYGNNAVILCSVQPELAALYNASSSNSQSLSTVPTNITNGLGIFTALHTDTVYVTVN
jgi:hypothetical protein